MSIGEVYLIESSDEQIYFQHIANDKSQLDSNVIRVFKKNDQELKMNTDLKSIVRSPVLFHAHVIISVGMKLKIWRSVGKEIVVEHSDVTFRSSDDAGNPDVKVSQNWWVWVANHSPKKIGALSPDYQNAEIGLVVTPFEILNRIRKGKYDTVYPE